MFNPITCIAIETIISIFFFILIVNIELIVYRLIKKLGLTIIFSFLSLNVLNFILSYFFRIISTVIKNKYISEAFYSFNIYHGFIGSKYIIFTFIIIFILSIISFIILTKLYKSKERMVLDFEQ